MVDGGLRPYLIEAPDATACWRPRCVHEDVDLMTCPDHSIDRPTSGSRLSDRSVDQRSQLTPHRVRGRRQLLGEETRDQLFVWFESEEGTGRAPRKNIARANRDHGVRRRNGGGKPKAKADADADAFVSGPAEQRARQPRNVETTRQMVGGRQSERILWVGSSSLAGTLWKEGVVAICLFALRTTFVGKQSCCAKFSHVAVPRIVSGMDRR